MSRMIVVSNRTPGDAPAAGGLAVALRDTLRGEGGLWIGWSGRLDPEPATELKFSQVGDFSVGTLDLSRQQHEAYYNGFSNSVLWPAFHLRLDLANFDPAWFAGYRAVNAGFARAIANILRPDDAIWVHDYHLIPLAAELRRLGVKNRIGFYLHIPFPTPDALMAIPHHAELLTDLAAYDAVGLQAERDVTAINDAVGLLLQGESLFAKTRISAIPIGSDPEAIADLSRSPAAAKMAQRMRKTLGDRSLILGVDRLDYSKGLPQRVEAYELLLERNADLRRRIHFLQIAPPSRDGIAQYQQTQKTLDEMSGRVMGRFAEPDWQPLTYVKRPYGQASLTGLMRLARVGLVTPLRDGMNLVAHEYIASQDAADPGVLVLSRFAGAAEILPDALLVNPFDPAEIAEAVATALAMSPDERIERWEKLREAISVHSVAAWAQRFLKMLKDRAVQTRAA